MSVTVTVSRSFAPCCSPSTVMRSRSLPANACASCCWPSAYCEKCLASVPSTLSALTSRSPPAAMVFSASCTAVHRSPLHCGVCVALHAAHPWSTALAKQLLPLFRTPAGPPPAPPPSSTSGGGTHCIGARITPVRMAFAANSLICSAASALQMSSAPAFVLSYPSWHTPYSPCRAHRIAHSIVVSPCLGVAARLIVQSVSAVSPSVTNVTWSRTYFHSSVGSPIPLPPRES